MELVPPSNREVYSLLFQTNCRKKGTIHHQNKIPGHLHNPSSGRVTKVHKNEKNTLDHFGKKKEKKKHKVKWENRKCLK